MKKVVNIKPILPNNQIIIYTDGSLREDNTSPSNKTMGSGAAFYESNSLNNDLTLITTLKSKPTYTLPSSTKAEITCNTFSVSKRRQKPKRNHPYRLQKQYQLHSSNYITYI